MSAEAKATESVVIARFAKVCGFAADEPHAHAVSVFTERLRTVPEFARKLLAHVIAMAYREHRDVRKPGTTYLPELHETCGLGVDEMYSVLGQLEAAKLIVIEGEYPFQDVVLADSAEFQWALTRDLAQFCASERVALRDLIVDLRFDRLS